MKNKIIGCVMACAMVMPATMALTGCGKGGNNGPTQHTITLNVYNMNNFATFVNSDNLVATPGQNNKTTFTTKVESGKDYVFAFKYAPGFDHDGTGVNYVSTEKMQTTKATELEETKVYYNDANKTIASENIDFTVDRIIEYKLSNIQEDTTISAELDSFSIRYRVLTIDSSLVQGAKYMLTKNGFSQNYDLNNRTNFTPIYDVPANGEIVIDEETYNGEGGCVLFLDSNIDAIDIVRKPLEAPGDINFEGNHLSTTLYANYTNAGNKALFDGKTAFVLTAKHYHSTVYAKQKTLNNYKDELKYNTGGADNKDNFGVAQVAHQDLFTLYGQETSAQYGWLPFEFLAFSEISETVDVYPNADDGKDYPYYFSADGTKQLISLKSKNYYEFNFESASAYIGYGAIDAENSFIKHNASLGNYSNSTTYQQKESEKFANCLGKNIYVLLNFDKNTFLYRNEQDFEMYNVEDFNYYIVGPDGTKTMLTNFVTMYDSSQREYKFAVVTPNDYAKYLATGYGRAGNSYRQYKTGYAFFGLEPKTETKSKMVKINVNCSDIEADNKGLDDVHLTLAQYDSRGEIKNSPGNYLTKFSSFNPLNGKLTYYADKKELEAINVTRADGYDMRIAVKLPISYNRDSTVNGLNKICESITVTVTDQNGNKVIDNKTYAHPENDTTKDHAKGVILLDDFPISESITELTFDIKVNYAEFEQYVGDNKEYTLKIHDLGNDLCFVDNQNPLFTTKNFSSNLNDWNKFTTGELGKVKIGDTLYFATSVTQLSLVQVEFGENNPASLIKTYRGLDCEMLIDNITGEFLKIYDNVNKKWYYVFKVTIPENNFNHIVDDVLYIENDNLDSLD